MSDTPRTDAVQKANHGHPLRMMRMTDHARKMERELTAAQSDLGAAQHELDVWQCMACELVKHVQGLSDEDCKLLDAFEKLKGAKP